MPIIDKELPLDKLRKERKHSSKVLVLAMTLIAVLVLGATAGLIGQIGNSKEPLPSETPVRIPARIAYTTHSPISIIGNGGFTNESGVVWGSGTESDPYIIEGWDISASTANGIDLQNTDAHFTVRTCHVYDGGFSYDGIHLELCANGTLDSNNCTNNWAGIDLKSSHSNTLSNNTCSNKYIGIQLGSSSDNNTLTNNTCSSSTYGIYLDHSSENTLVDNTCSNNYHGICLVLSSDNNNIHNNNCSNNLNHGVYLVSSNGNTLSNNNCGSNDYNGMILSSSYNNNIWNNNCSNNWHGISLDSSSNNILVNNTCGSNYMSGINLFSSSGNTLSNNNCSNNECGIVLYSSSDSNTLSNNNCSTNNGQGIDLTSSSSNTLSDNNCLSDYYGIYLYDSSGNTIVKNSISGNIGYGLHLTGYLLFSNSNRIWSNSFMYNNGAGDTFDPAHVQAYDDGSDNWWNSTDGYGNWWSDWRAPDDNWDGIVDNPYNISGSAGAKDYYPQTVPGTPIPEFGMMPLIMMVFVMAIVLTIGARRRKEH